MHRTTYFHNQLVSGLSEGLVEYTVLALDNWADLWSTTHRKNVCVNEQLDGLHLNVTKCLRSWDVLLKSAWKKKCFSYCKRFFNAFLIFIFDLVIFNQNVETWSSSDFSNHFDSLTAQTPPVFTIAASFHSDLPASNQQPLGWTKFTPYIFFPFSIICFT